MKPNMRNLASGLVAVLIAAMAVNAHEVPVVAPENLVPIPEYSQGEVPASGAAALAAAQTFLVTLSDAQRAEIELTLEHPMRKSGWSNLPASFVKRPGLNLGELDEHQRIHLFEFLSASLSPEGYERVADIIAGEAYLSTDPAAERFQWAPENYWLVFFGEISAGTLWGWQFGGHHLGLNVSVNEGRINSMSPSFVGTEPAVFTYNGVEYANIRDMHLAGYEMFQALTDDNKKRAMLHSVPGDVVTGPGKDGLQVPQVGVLGSQLDDVQRAQLLELISLWVEIQPDENATERMVQLEQELDQISFAWTGSPENNEEAYFRVQGPTLIIELKSDGNNVGQTAKGKGHYHTIYRNPQLEYGEPYRSWFDSQ